MATDGPSLVAGGGGGGPGAVDTSYLLYPVPPPGRLAIFCAWPAHGIDETRTEFDGSGLAALQAQVETLWPIDTREPWPPTPPKPVLPAGGWFAAYASGA